MSVKHTLTHEVSVFSVPVLLDVHVPAYQGRDPWFCGFVCPGWEVLQLFGFLSRGL